MKTKLFALMALVSLMMISCEEPPYIAAPGNNDLVQGDTIPEFADPTPSPDPDGIEIPEGAINVNEAVKIGQKLAYGQTTEETYYIKGWVRNFDEAARSKSKPDWETSFAQYGNDYVHLSARQDGLGMKDFYCYRVLGRSGAKLPSHDVLQIGDFIVVKCKIQNYDGTIENNGQCSIEVSNNEAYNNAFRPIDSTNVTPDPAGVEVPESAITVYKAREISESLGSGNTTQEKYYIKGWVSRIDSKHADGVNQYGNGTFYITPTNDGTTESVTFEAFQVYGKDGKKLTSPDQVEVGDFVVIYGQITNYNGTAETTGKGTAYIYSSSNEKFNEAFQPADPTKITPDPEGADVPEGTLTVYEALHIGDSIGSGKTTTDEYYIKGWVSKLHSNHASGVTSFGNGTFFITPTNDGTTASISFEAYQVYGKNKQKLTSADQVAVGDFVVLRGKITNYNGTVETVGKGAAYIYYSTNEKW